MFLIFLKDTLRVIHFFIWQFNMSIRVVVNVKHFEDLVLNQTIIDIVQVLKWEEFWELWCVQSIFLDIRGETLLRIVLSLLQNLFFPFLLICRNMWVSFFCSVIIHLIGLIGNWKIFLQFKYFGIKYSFLYFLLYLCFDMLVMCHKI